MDFKQQFCFNFSTYCGGMWLGALKAFLLMADTLKMDEELEKYSEILEKAKHNFERKLWNGNLH